MTKTLSILISAIIIIVGTLMLSACSSNKKNLLSSGEKQRFIESKTSTISSISNKQERINSQVNGSHSITSHSASCKHGNYTLKTSYKTYQEAQTDYNMLSKYLKEHDSSDCTRDPAVTKKLKNDIAKMEEILKGLPVPSVVMTKEKKLEAINYTIETFYEILQWEGGDQDEETKRLYEQAQEYKKQYENNQISLDTCYEKVKALKYQ